MNKLQEIVQKKRLEIEELKKSEIELEPQNNLNAKFGKSILHSDCLGLVCEVKRSSPSAGTINANVNPVEIAGLYDQHGADAISVLTDKTFFSGSFEFLSNIYANVNTPLLCKDFILDEIQIQLAAQSGASAVLLITECLSDNELKDLYDKSLANGMDALVEAHELHNIERAVQLGARIIGINNRNLKTFEIDINYGFNHVHLIPDDRIRMNLSAYELRQQAEEAVMHGFDAILVGTTLMKAKNTAEAVNAFKGVLMDSSDRLNRYKSKLNYYEK